MRERLRQIRQVFAMTRESDPRVVLYVILGAVVGAAVGAVLGWLLQGTLLAILSGIMFAALGAMSVLGRRAQKAQFHAIEGRPGAAAAVVQAMRGQWLVTPAVAVTRKQDLVHRVVGRPGVVLVGEGSPARVASMLKKERRRLERVVGDTPVHEVTIGDGPDEVQLRKLRVRLMKLPRTLKKGEVAALDTRLNALADRDLPLPKGPLPRQVRRR